MKKKSQIITVIGVTTISVGAVLGVYFGVQNSKKILLKDLNFGEKYFRKNVLNDKNYLYNKIAFIENGENLGFLNRLEMLHYNNSKNKEFLKKDPKNNLLNKNKIIINYSSKLSKTQIQNIYLKVNKKLSFEINKIKKRNKIGDLGIEFIKKIDKSTVEIKIFEIKSFNQEDNLLIDEFLNDLGTIKKPKNGWTPNRFYRMYTSEVKLRNEILEHFNFSVSDDYYKKWEDGELNSQNNGKFLVDIRTTKNYITEDNKKNKLYFIKKLAENNIIPTITPLIDWKNKKSKILFRFFKTSKNDNIDSLDESIITSGSTTYLWNPIAIRSKIFEYDLIEFGNKNPAKGNRKENGEIVKKFFVGDNSFAAWTNKKIITISLSIIKEQIPSLTPFLKKMLFLGKILNKKDENNKNNLKYSSIFEDEITLEIDGHSKTGKLQELILDILQKDDIADADAFVEIIKQFISKEPLAIKNEKFDKKNINLTNFEDWSNFEKMKHINYKNGGMYKFFKLHSAFNVFYDYVIKSIENKFGNLIFEKENSNVIKNLHIFLKEEKLIDSNISINEILSNFQEIVPNIFEKIIKNKVLIPKKIIQTLLSLISISNISNNLNLITNNIYDLFKNNKFSLIWKILGKTNEIRKETIIKLFSNEKRIEAIINILNNKLEKESVKTLFNFLDNSKLLPSFLKPLKNENNLEIIYKFFNEIIKGSTSAEKISNFLKKTTKDGLTSITLNEFKEILKIIVKIYKKEFDKLKFLTKVNTNNLNDLSWENKDSDDLAKKIHNFILNGLGGNQKNANNSVEGILILIKLFINQKNSEIYNWFKPKKIAIILNKFLNFGIKSMGIQSYKTIFNLIFNDINKIENIGKELGFDKKMLPRIKNFISEISYKFLILGVNDLDIIKKSYNDFINDDNNLDIKIALHTFINNKIILKENQLKTKEYLDDNLNPLEDEWKTWKNKYIPKLNFKGYVSSKEENTINSILDMNLIDFIVVFSKDDNLDPIELAAKDNKARLNLNSFNEWKLYYGSIFDSFKRFYNTNGQIIKNKLGNDVSDEFKNYNFINKFKNLFEKETKNIFDLFLNIPNAKLIFNKLTKTITNILKTGISTTKLEWKNHIENIISFIEEYSKIINKISEISPSIKKINDKYILKIIELFEIGKKQNNGNFVFINPNNNLIDSQKVEKLASSFSNLFSKAINNVDPSKNMAKNDLEYFWKLLKFFLNNNLPKNMPKIIQNILIDKTSFGNFTTFDIEQLILIINIIWPNTQKFLNFFNPYLNEIIIGSKKIMLERIVMNIYDSNKEIIFNSKEDNKFLNHEENIKSFLNSILNNNKNDIKIEKIIIPNRNIVLNESNFVKFKVEYSIILNNKKIKFITPYFKIKISNNL